MKPNAMIKVLGVKYRKHKGNRTACIYLSHVFWTDEKGKVVCTFGRVRAPR